MIWLALAGACALEKSRVESRLRPADGTVLTTADGPLRIGVSKTTSGETVRHVIRAAAPDGRVFREWEFTVNWDLFGGGFVAAVDLQDDGQPEILAWGANENRDAFLLQVRGGDIVVRRGPDLPPAATDLASNWHRACVQRPMGMGLLLVPAGLYTVFSVVVLLVVRRVKGRKAPPAPASDG